MKWNMIIDVAKCENCRNCFLAAKDEHVGNDFPGYAAPQPLHGHQWIDIRQHERGKFPILDVHYMPVMCNHCDDAPCIRAARDGAAYKRADGIVIIDPQKAKGQKQIADACPYGAAFWNEELQVPQIWIFDAHLLDQGWKRTRAEQVCPTGVFRSLKVGDEDMQRIAQQERLETLRAELNTRPRVYYKNLHLMNRCFIAGTVVTRQDGREECLAGATVTLNKAGTVLASTTSDEFGEFKIDLIEPDSGEYEVKLEAQRQQTATRKVRLGASQYIGAIEL